MCLSAGSHSAEFTIEFGDTTSRTYRVELSGCKSPEAGLQFMYGGDSLSGLELDGETSEITVELQNNGLEDLQVNLETSEEWLRIITVQSNPRLVASGGSLEIQLKYTCEEVGISPAYLSASVEGGGYITLPVNIEGCDTPPGNDLTVSIDGVEASKIELYAQWEEGGENPSQKSRLRLQITASIPLPSTLPCL